MSIYNPQKIKKGEFVKSLKVLRNAVGELPKGTIFIVIGSYRGLDLIQYNRCNCCGIRLSISKVYGSDIKRLTQEEINQL